MLDKVVSLGLLAVIILAPTQYSVEVTEKTFLSVVDPLVLAVVALWILKVIRSRDLSLLTPPPLFTWLFVLQAALSLLKTESVLSSLKECFQILEYFVFAFLVFSSNLRDAKRLRRAVVVFLCTATAVVGMGAVQYLRPGAVPDFRVGATLSNRNVLGGFLSLALPVFYGLLVLDRNLWRRAWYALVILTGFAVNLSGGSVSALFVSFAVVSALVSRRLCLIFACVFVLFFGVILPHMPRSNGAVLLDSVAIYRDGTPTTRYPEWQAALVMTEENPWLGVGAGTYQRHIGRYYGAMPSPSIKSEADSQNLYLVLSSTMGVPGLLCFLGMLCVFGSRAARVLLQPGEAWRRGLAAGLVGSIVAFAVNSVWAPLLVRGIGLPLAFVFSLAVALGEPHGEQAA